MSTRIVGASGVKRCGPSFKEEESEGEKKGRRAAAYVFEKAEGPLYGWLVHV